MFEVVLCSGRDPKQLKIMHCKSQFGVLRMTCVISILAELLINALAKICKCAGWKNCECWRGKGL